MINDTFAMINGKRLNRVDIDSANILYNNNVRIYFINNNSNFMNNFIDNFNYKKSEHYETNFYDIINRVESLYKDIIFFAEY